MLLQGKTVIVIGGSSGVGLQVARQAQAEGASLVLVGRNQVKVDDAAAALGEICRPWRAMRTTMRRWAG